MWNYLGNSDGLVEHLDIYGLCGTCAGPPLIKYVATHTIPRGRNLGGFKTGGGVEEWQMAKKTPKNRPSEPLTPFGETSPVSKS